MRPSSFALLPDYCLSEHRRLAPAGLNNVTVRDYFVGFLGGGRRGGGGDGRLFGKVHPGTFYLGS